MKKEIYFRLFKVTNDVVKDAENPLKSRLSQKLDDDKKFVNARIMKLKDSGPSDEDILASVTKSSDYVYGVMMRVALAKDVPELPTDLDLNNLENIDVNAILKEAEKDGSGKKVCKSIYRFFIYEDYVVVDMPKSMQINRLENYLNWFLMLPDSMKFSINPVVETGIIKLDRLSSVVFMDAFCPLPTENNKSGIRRIIDKCMNYLIEGDDVSMKSLHDANIVSAKLTLEFNKDRKMTTEEYAKKMSAILKTSVKPDNVRFVLNDKSAVSGNKVLYGKTVTIESYPSLTDKDYINAMKDVINEYSSSDQ